MCLNLSALAICAEFYRNEQYKKLQQENEKLELEIFLKKIDNLYLSNLFNKYNMTKSLCACHKCISLGYFDDDLTEEEFINKGYQNYNEDNCIFLNQIQEKLTEFNLTISFDNNDNGDISIDLTDVDNTNWDCLYLGKSIKKAKSINDSVIQNFKELINYLEQF
jgi:hypothetical protein